jgi:hypothetical protein
MAARARATSTQMAASRNLRPYPLASTARPIDDASCCAVLNRPEERPTTVTLRTT